MPTVRDRVGDVSIQPIETRYDGHKFRSRLEARWAVFFNALGVAWGYEPQGYVITDPWGNQSRNYLPDFYLPGLDVFAEVKGDPSAVDWVMWCVAVDAASGTGLPDSVHSRSGFERSGGALLVLGNIPPVSTRAWLHPIIVNHKGASINQVAFGSRPDDFGMEVMSELAIFESSWSGFNADVAWCYDSPIDHNGEPAGGSWKEPANPKVAAAYDRARQARFEHGAAG